MAKFKKGDRVRYIRDTEYYGVNYGGVNYGDVGVIDENGSDAPYCLFDTAIQRRVAFLEDELELVTNSKGATIVSERRTFKQLKDSYHMTKGALWQEECDDGTQPYKVINASEVYKGKDTRNTTAPDRTIIEEQPDWFVEVFKVHPEYLEKGEIEAWEHFRKTYKKPATKTKVSKHVPRLVEVVDMHNIGMTNKAIARKLKIRPESVYTYLWKARKTGLLG